MVKKNFQSEPEFLEAVDRRSEALIKAAGFTERSLNAAPSLQFVLRHCSGIMEAVVCGLKKRDDAIERLAKRVEELEAGGIKYLGTYQRASSYRKGDTITHSGSMWVALKAVPEGIVPGSSQDHWQLSQKGKSQ